MGSRPVAVWIEPLAAVFPEFRRSMRRVLQIALTTAAVGAAITALVAAAMPIWLLLRVPAAIVPPDAGQVTPPRRRSVDPLPIM